MTCATFSVLETVHMQNVQAKSGVYDLYKALERLTDNTGLVDVRVRELDSASPFGQTYTTIRIAIKHFFDRYGSGSI